LEILEHESKSVLFRVECEGGTYIRNLCDDIGSVLGTKGVMEQLIRSKSGPFKLEDSFSLIEAHDIYQNWKSSSEEKDMKRLLRPLEDMLVDLPKIEVKDSAVDAICHGADLAIPGISAVSKKLKRGQLVSLVSGQGESIALGRATIDANEIINKKNEKGKAVKLERVIMERGTYPREWKTK
jgi:H/ACA ribonucleoprotein complex subunit 4